MQNATYFFKILYIEKQTRNKVLPEAPMGEGSLHIQPTFAAS